METGGLLANDSNAVLTSITPQYPINTTVDLYSNSNNSNCGSRNRKLNSRIRYNTIYCNSRQ